MQRWNAMQPEDVVNPGPFYVTAMNDTYSWMMRGPFETHAEALDAVAETVQKARALDPRAEWMAWGTSRLKAGHRPDPGKMNRYFETIGDKSHEV